MRLPDSRKNRYGGYLWPPRACVCDDKKKRLHLYTSFTFMHSFREESSRKDLRHEVILNLAPLLMTSRRQRATSIGEDFSHDGMATVENAYSERFIFPP